MKYPPGRFLSRCGLLAGAGAGVVAAFYFWQKSAAHDVAQTPGASPPRQVSGFPQTNGLETGPKPPEMPRFRPATDAAEPTDEEWKVIRAICKDVFARWIPAWEKAHATYLPVPRAQAETHLAVMLPPMDEDVIREATEEMGRELAQRLGETRAHTLAATANRHLLDTVRPLKVFSIYVVDATASGSETVRLSTALRREQVVVHEDGFSINEPTQQEVQAFLNATKDDEQRMSSSSWSAEEAKARWPHLFVLEGKPTPRPDVENDPFAED